MNSTPRCAICGAFDDVFRTPEREGADCSECRSTWRTRATAVLVMRGLGLDPRPLVEVEPDRSRHGVGIGDNHYLAAQLARTFAYTNTFIDTEPVLDLLDIPYSMAGLYDFATCSDVLEHVPPPADRAVRGLASLARPGGFVVISVPIRDGETDEYYPGMVDCTIADGTLHWFDADGVEHVDPDPEIHGGDGLTVAFRCWGTKDFERVALASGFSSIERLEPCPELGVPAMPWKSRSAEVPPLMSGMWLARR